MKLDSLFILGKSVSPKARDGSERKLHRIGRARGAYTRGQLFSKLGLEKEYKKTCKKLQRKFHDSDEFEELAIEIHARRMARLGGWIQDYRGHLTKYYADQDLEPVMYFVPVDEDRSNDILFLQGFVDPGTDNFVTGDFEDVVLALESSNVRRKPQAEKYDRTRKIARNMLKLPGVNRDLRDRLLRVASGTIDRPMLKERFES
jgi:hypothetical protein